MSAICCKKEETECEANLESKEEWCGLDHGGTWLREYERSTVGARNCSICAVD